MYIYIYICIHTHVILKTGITLHLAGIESALAPFNYLQQKATFKAAFKAAAATAADSIPLAPASGFIYILYIYIYSLPETNSSPVKMDDPFLLGLGLFSGANCEFQGSNYFF